MLNHYRPFVRRLPFTAVVLISLGVLFTPASGVPSTPPGSDKLVHLVLFTALTITGRGAGIPVRALWVGLGCYAVGSEVMQSILPLGREGDVADAAFDVLGITAGSAAWSAGAWMVRRLRD